MSEDASHLKPPGPGEDYDLILCVCCEESVAVIKDYTLGPICGDCSVAARNAQDALTENAAKAQFGGWSDICRENGNITEA
jgi:hypothetical protein